MAQCQFCSWKTDHPKAFRMRNHALACDGLPADKRAMVEQWQQEKDAGKPDTGAEGGAPTQAKKRKQSGAPGAGAGAVKTMPPKSPITCHVLDSTSGKPAAGMQIRVDRLSPTGFAQIATAVTDSDGRCSTLIPSSFKMEVGIFKITFMTSEYFTSRGILSFYPFVEIPFEVKTLDEHYHVPLLLSPYAYSTYRGS
ncbi:hypothetical protein MNV49_002150 [Pseudohyphozyma bogoriensis]|nr:hypothetical protein MNV49_002150 [Pseudohyphozyma bogoriensis]